MISKVFKYRVNQVMDACIKALEEVEGYNISRKDKENIVKASIRGSIFSWGEDVFIKVTPINDNQTKVEVESSSKAQIIDWGTNDNNEHRIMSGIVKKLNSTR